jgi:ribonuclease-3
VAEAPLESNERLEFLGDAVLGLIIAQHLYESFPEREEGDLAKSRSLVVSKLALAEAARHLDLVSLLQLGATEEAMGGRSRSSLIADAYEAILAVIYLESGLEVAREFVLTTLSPALERMQAAADLRDPKTILQEYCQAEKQPLPVYQIVDQRGKPHDRTFIAEVLLQGKVWGKGTGKSKKEAEQAAAEAALARRQE